MEDDTSPGVNTPASRAMADIVAPTMVQGAPIVDAKDGKQPDPASERKTARFRLLINPTLQDLLSLSLSLGALVSVLAVLVLLGWDTYRKTTTIEPISVPNKF